MENLQYQIQNIQQAAAYLISQLGTTKVVTFTAPMGAGKTTLITAICHQLQVVDVPTSPTYSIINEYITSLGSSVYHIDLYRVKDEEELWQLGLDEIVNSGNYCFVEWPQLALPLLPTNTIAVNISIVNTTERVINFA